MSASEDRHHKSFVKVSKTAKNREGSWVYITKTGNFTCPYTYFIKYFEWLVLPRFRKTIFSPGYNTYDRHSEENVLSTRFLSPGRATDILKEKNRNCWTHVALVITALGPAELQPAANLNVSGRPLTVHGRWDSDSAKDALCVCDNVDSRPFVPMNI